MTVSDFVDQKLKVSGKVALITFDDGYLDTLVTAAPALAERSLASTVYITSGFLKGRGEQLPGPPDPMMTWPQLNELEAFEIEIGAHSHSHRHMDTLSRAAINDELTRPKAMIEGQLGHAIRSFAYPHGYCGPRVRRLTKAAGYESAAGVRNLFSHTDDDNYNIARLTITNNTSAFDVEQWLDGSGSTIAASKEALKTTGWRMYRRSKAILTRTPGSDYT